MFDRLGEAYLSIEQPLAQAQLVLFMLGMGATLTLKDFAIVFRQPKALTYGLIWVLLITPFLAVGVAKIAGVPAGVAFGLLLVGTLSGGTLSNFFTYLARANVALSIALSGCGAFLCMVTVPFFLELLAGDFVPANFEMPVWGIIRDILIFMMLPLAVGMLIARYLHRYRMAVSKGAIWLGVFLIAVMVVGSFISDRIELDRYGWGVPLTILFYVLLAQQFSMLPIRILGWPTRDFAAIGIEVTIRNVYLAIMLVILLFPSGVSEAQDALGDDALFTVLFYGATSLCANVPLSLRLRRVHRRESARLEKSTDG